MLVHKEKNNGKALPVFVILFLVGICIPLIINVGSVRLSAYRIVLTLSFIPMLFVLFSGRVGRLNIGDICVFLICIWAAISLLVNHGLVGN